MASSPITKRTDLAAWKEKALSRLGPSTATTTDMFPVVDATDASEQTNFGDRYIDRETITSIATADLRRLIPIPETSLLVRSTRASLKQAEQDARVLLNHVQRELEKQLQDAGMSFQQPQGMNDFGFASGTMHQQLRYRSIAAVTENDGDDNEYGSFGGAAATRGVGGFDGGSRGVGSPFAGAVVRDDATAVAAMSASWSSPSATAVAAHQAHQNRARRLNTDYLRHQETTELYPPSMIKRAAAMESMRLSLLHRHKVFADIDRDLVEQREALQSVTSSASLMTAAAATPDVTAKGGGQQHAHLYSPTTALPTVATTSYGTSARSGAFPSRYAAASS